MTRIDVAPDLVEEAAFAVASHAADLGNPRALEWLEHRERLYEIPPGARREQAFREHALAAFRRFRLDEPLRIALEACPVASRRLDTLFVRRARRAKEESAELYCAEEPASGGRATRAVLALRPERFAEVEPLYEFVRRELLFVDDMLDEAFGYSPQALDRLELEPGQRDVARERVSRAWKRRVEARARGEVAAGSFTDLLSAAVASLGATRPAQGQECPHPCSAAAGPRSAANGTP